jgi:hypothetical protein
MYFFVSFFHFETHGFCTNTFFMIFTHILLKFHDIVNLWCIPYESFLACKGFHVHICGFISSHIGAMNFIIFLPCHLFTSCCTSQLMFFPNELRQNFTLHQVATINPKKNDSYVDFATSSIKWNVVTTILHPDHHISSPIKHPLGQFKNPFHHYIAIRVQGLIITWRLCYNLWSLDCNYSIVSIVRLLIHQVHFVHQHVVQSHM